MAKDAYIQVGVSALRDPKTGDVLSAVPLYVRTEDAGENAELPMFKDGGKAFARKINQYKAGCEAAGVSI